MTKLWFVCAEDDDGGENAGLLVRADSAEEAVGFWLNYYLMEEVRCPVWAGEVPEAPARGAIPWADIQQNRWVPKGEAA